MMKCPNCGQEFEGNFCPNCGTAANGSDGNTPMPDQENKKPKKKKHGCLTAFIVVIVILIILGAIGSAGGDSSASSSSSSSAGEATEPTQTPSPTQQTESENSEVTSGTDSTSDSSSDVTLDLMAAAFQVTLQNSFDNSDLTYDDTSITMNVWQDNVAAGALLAQQGNEELRDQWDDMRKNMRQMCQSSRDALDQAGLDDVSVTLNLVNDMNQDNTLLTIVDGVVVYDAVYDYSME